LIKAGEFIMGRRKKVSKDAGEIFSFDCDEEEDNGFSENVEQLGNVITSFSFSQDVVEKKTELHDNTQVPEQLIDNRTLQKQPYGITPPVDGEHFEVRRTFVFRRSTVRMLNKLKAEHEDENVYLSSIVDEAIRHYFEFIFN
jgi:hypothetical protein